MDKKAQTVGWIVVAFIAVVVGLSFWTLMGDNIGTMTRILTNTNTSFTFPVGTAKELTMCGQRVVTITIMNTTGYVIAAGNYTTSQSAGEDGYLTAKIINTTAAWTNNATKVTCTYQPKGYIDDGGSRAVVTLIAVMMAILIMVSAMPDLRNGVIDFIKGV